MGPDFIPVSTPLLDGRESDYLRECVETGWVSSDGPFVARLEAAMAARVGRAFAVAVSSGTSALQVGVAGLGLQPGDEVIVPTFSIISCTAAILRQGATPVLCDSDPKSWNMTAATVEPCITPRTRALMVVHTYGLPVDMDPLMQLAEANGLRVIEDAAEALGGYNRARACGAFGDVSVLSFYANKPVTCGEGGMLLTDDPDVAAHARALRNLFFEPKQRFVHRELGYNFRMSNLQAAVGLAQLERLDNHLERKRSIAARYTNSLRDQPGLQLPLDQAPGGPNTYWVYGVLLESQPARPVMEALARRGVGTRPFFFPMHRQPVFQDRGLFAEARFPVADGLAERGFYLPSGTATTDEQVDRVVDALRSVLAGG